MVVLWNRLVGLLVNRVASSSNGHLKHNIEGGKLSP